MLNSNLSRRWQKLAGATAVALVADVLDDHDVSAMMDSVRAVLGSLDIAVNNVGMLGGHHAAALVETSVEGLRAVLERNLLATLRCCRAEAAAMIAAGGGGVIVNVSSGESLRPAPGLAAYGAAKAGINHLTQTLAVELGPHGIRVNAMAPGTTLTEQVRAGLPADYLEALRASIPLGRMVDPDDMGRTAVYLASDLARNVTGQLVLADAGAHLSRNRPQLPRR